MNKAKTIIGLLIIIIIILIAGIFILNSQPQKAASQITICNSSLYEGETLTIKLTDTNSTPIANQTLNVTVLISGDNTYNYKLNTDSNGTANLGLENLSSSNYTIEVKYGGNENYTQTSASQNLEIKEKVVAENTQSSGSSQSDENDSYWETSPDANTPYHTEYYSDGGFRQYDPQGNLVGSSYDDDQEEVGNNVGGYRI
ncbi:MAG: hypothetical protein IJF83_11545 [Methanobrevibacter sp.]|nr:hypothetical protein [Methanobrevibacter sp.]